MPHWRPEALASEFAAGEIRLIRREAVGGVPAFLYETKIHPGGVSTRETTTEFWVGTNDNLLLKSETLTKETAQSSGGVETRYTVSCSYGPAPEIKPPF